ncbi:hypothetical protein CCP3SC15_1610013 [Gammaproteobacteria bacterium]
MDRRRLLTAVMSGSAQYWQRIKPIFDIALWPCWDAVGSTTAVDLSTHGFTGTNSDGVFGGTGIGDGHTAITLDGASGSVDVFSAGLAAALNHDNFSIAGWCTSDWTADGKYRFTFKAYTNDNNYLGFLKNGDVAGTVFWEGKLGGDARVGSFATGSPAGFFPWGLTFDSLNGIYFYVNGSQVDALYPIWAAWAGGAITSLRIGSSNTPGPFTNWKGKIAYQGLSSSILTPAQMAKFARKSGIIYFDGDSRTIGPTFATSYPSQAVPTIDVTAKNLAWVNFGLASANFVDMNTSALTHIDPQRVGNDTVVVFCGITDANGGATAAQIHDRMRAYCLARRAAGFRVIACTEIDSQVAASNAVNWHTSLWAATNAAIKADWTTWSDKQVDLGALPHLQDATDATYFNADKIHLTATGCGVVAAAVATAYNA